MILYPLSKVETNTGRLAYYSFISLDGDTTFYSNFSSQVSGIPFDLIVDAGSGGTAAIYLYPTSELTPGQSFNLPLPSHLFENGEVPTIPPLTFGTAPPVVIPDTTPLFQIMEKSELSEPVELYEFTLGYTATERNLGAEYTGAAVSYRYTSGNDFVYKDENLFVPEPIQRDEVQSTVEINRATLTLTVPKNNELAKLFVAGTPAFPILLRVFRAFTGADAHATSYMVIFSGRISACTFSGFEARITCDPIYSTIKRQGLRRKYESNCPHNLYSTACGVVKAGVTLTLHSITTVSGSQITIADAAFLAKDVDKRNPKNGLVEAREIVDSAGVKTYVTGTGYYSGGMLKLADGSFHLITKHEVGKITLLRPLPKNADLTDVQILPGCDRAFSTCKDKFHNESNFGGFPWLPDANPFIGTHVPAGG